MSSVETGQMSAVERGQMFAVETGQMSAAETRHLSCVEKRNQSSVVPAAVTVRRDWRMPYFIPGGVSQKGAGQAPATSMSLSPVV